MRILAIAVTTKFDTIRTRKKVVLGYFFIHWQLKGCLGRFSAGMI